jgi:hypothetical protein
MRARWLACAVLASGPTARAAAASDAGPSGTAPTVVVLTSPDSDDVTVEATARVQGELQAAGFRVVTAGRSGDGPSGDIETAGNELRPVGAFAIAVRPGPDGMIAEIQVSDRLRHKTLVERARLPQLAHGRDSEVLAVRAVELLKASLADVWLQPPAIVAPPAPSVAPPSANPHDTPAPTIAPAARRPFGAGLGLGAGVGMMARPGEIGPIWMPELLVSFGFESGLGLRLELQGLGPSVQIRAAAGSAVVEPWVAAVGLTKTWWPRWPVVPFVAGAAGVAELHVRGAAAPPYRGQEANQWSAWTDVGLGAAVPIYGGFSLVTESGVAGVWPPTTIRIAGSEVGAFGGISWFGDVRCLGVFP